MEKALALAPEYGVDDLAAVLLEMLDDIRSPTEAHRKQIQALNQQGAGRFTGVASTCRAWGLIECVPAQEQEENEKEETTKTRKGVLPMKPPACNRRIPTKRPACNPRHGAKRTKSEQGEAGEGEEQASPLPSRRAQEEAQEEDQWHLGLTRRAYRRTGAHESLGELVQAARDFPQPPEIIDATTFQEMVSWAEDFDQFLMQKSTTWTGQVGYVHDFLRRKLVLGQLSSSSGCADLQWSEVSVDCLKQMSPDMGDYLSRVPAKWSAADLSRYCTDRDDWGRLRAHVRVLVGCGDEGDGVPGASRRVDRVGCVGRTPGRSPGPHQAIRRDGACAHVGEAVRPAGHVAWLAASPCLVAGSQAFAASQGHDSVTGTRRSEWRRGDVAGPSA